MTLEIRILMTCVVIGVIATSALFYLLENYKNTPRWVAVAYPVALWVTSGFVVITILNAIWR